MKLFTAVYYEPGILEYPLGQKLKQDDGIDEELEENEEK